MPRQARIDAPGALHHIIFRGIECRPIFKDDIDRDDFLGRLTPLCVETSTECLAWALLPNHVHLLLRTGQVPIATIMRRLLTGYAVKFNRRHDRHGHLFQNRYKSILCQEELYLLELVRYIHLNPLRAGQVATLEELKGYPYCGHSRLMGKKKDDLQNVEVVLERFGKRRTPARKGYEAFVADGLPQGKRPDLIGGGLIRSSGGWQKVKENRQASLESKSDERILGDSSFVEEVLKQAEEEIARKADSAHRGITFDELIKLAAQRFGLEPGDLLRPGKQPLRVNGRSLLCFWSVCELGMTASEVGKRVGLTQSAVSRAVPRGEKLSVEMKIDLPEGNA
jgi:REP element-mobilizing transposase RayT